jgi:hypothetical protein
MISRDQRHNPAQQIVSNSASGGKFFKKIYTSDRPRPSLTN